MQVVAGRGSGRHRLGPGLPAPPSPARHGTQKAENGILHVLGRALEEPRGLNRGRLEIMDASHQLPRRNPEALREREDARQRWVTPASFDAPDVVRREPGALRELLQGQAQRLSPPTHFLAEVHGAEGRGDSPPGEHTMVLTNNTIV